MIAVVKVFGFRKQPARAAPKPQEKNVDSSGHPYLWAGPPGTNCVNSEDLDLGVIFGHEKGQEQAFC
jgi:hypothetical protein